MKKRLVLTAMLGKAVLAAVLVLGLALTGCGDNGDPSSPGGGGSEQTGGTGTGGTGTGGTTTKPGEPTNVTATVASSSSITVSWDAVSGATSYKVYYEMGPTSYDMTLADTVTATSYTHTGLKINTTYVYYIKAVNSAGESAAEGGAPRGAATTRLIVPSTPTNVTATALSSGSIEISWTAATGATSYKIYWGDKSSSAFTDLDGTSSTTSYISEDWPAGTTGYFKISAVNSDGESEKSSTVSAKTTGDGGTSGGGTSTSYIIDQALFNTSTTKKSGNDLVFNWTLKTSGKSSNGLYTYKAPDSIVVSILSDGVYLDATPTLAASARTYTLKNYASYVEGYSVTIRVKCVSTLGDKISYIAYYPGTDSFTPNYPN